MISAVIVSYLNCKKAHLLHPNLLYLNKMVLSHMAHMIANMCRMPIKLQNLPFVILGLKEVLMSASLDLYSTFLPDSQ